MKVTLRFLLEIGLIAVLGWIAHLFLSWWSVVVVAAGVGLFFRYRYSAFSFLAGFIGVGLLWGLALFFFTRGDGSTILLGRINELFGDVGTTTLAWGTISLGSLLGGLGALTGTLGRKVFEKV